MKYKNIPRMAIAIITAVGLVTGGVVTSPASVSAASDHMHDASADSRDGQSLDISRHLLDDSKVIASNAIN